MSKEKINVKSDCSNMDLLIHGTYLPHLDTILEYGLVTLFHFIPEGKLEGWYDKAEFGECPCMQQIPEELKNLKLPREIYFDIIPREFDLTSSSLKSDTHPGYARQPDTYHFALLVDPTLFSDETDRVTENLSLIEKLHKRDWLMGYYSTIGKKTKYPTYMTLTMYSCIPWEVFSALVVSDNPRNQFYSRTLEKQFKYDNLTKEMVVETLIDRMRSSKSSSKPIIDIRGNIIYQPE